MMKQVFGLVRESSFSVIVAFSAMTLWAVIGCGGGRVEDAVEGVKQVHSDVEKRQKTIDELDGK